MDRLAWKSWISVMVLVLVMTGLFGGLGYVYTRDVADKRVREELRLGVATRADRLDNALVEKQDMVAGVSRSRELMDWTYGETEGVQRLLDNMKRMDGSVLAMYVVKGTRVAHTTTGSDPVRSVKSLRDWYREKRTERKASWTRVERDSLGRYVTTVSFPVLVSGEIRAVVGMDVDVSGLMEKASVVSEVGYRSEIVSPGGFVMASSASERIGSRYSKRVDIADVYGEYVTDKWRVIGYVSPEEYAEALSSEMKWFWYVMVGLFGIASLLGMWVVYVWLRPIRVLERKAKKLGSNDIWDLELVRTNDALETIDDGMNLLVNRNTQVETAVVNVNRMMRTSLMNAVTAVTELTDRVDERISDIGETRSKVSSLLRRVGSSDVEMIQMEQEIRNSLEDVISMKREISEVSLLSERLVRLREDMDVTVYEEFAEVVTSMRDVCEEARDLATDLKERSTRGSLLAVALAIDAERSDEFGYTFVKVTDDVRREFIRLGDAMSEMDGKIREIEQSITGGMFDERSPLLWKTDIERMLSELTFVLESWSNMDGRMSELLVRMNSRLLRMLNVILDARKARTTTVEDLGEVLRDLDRLNERFETEKRAMDVVNYSNDQMYGLTEKIVNLNIEIAKVIEEGSE